MVILPTIKQLQYLTALYEQGHFGRAADASFVTQSTLSAGIRELETLLDANLVERTKRVVRFTPLGEKIVKKAYVLLREAEEIAQMAKASGLPLTGELRMGVIPTIAPFFLPTVLPKLRAAYPELKLFLREEMSHVACEALARGQLDCALIALPFACGDVETAALFDDQLYAAFHPDEYDRAPEMLFPADLSDDRLLFLEDGHCLKEHALAACDRPQLRSESTILGTSLHTLVQMVDNRLGMTLLPEMALHAGILANTSVRSAPIDSPSAKRQIALIWRRNSPRRTEFEMLANFFRTAHEADEQISQRTDAAAASSSRRSTGAAMPG